MMIAAPLDPSYTAQTLDQPVPEPASWAMMIGGFALVGAVMRHRSAAVRAA
ncbi:PEPxxWA-CTERM sorting domain-containing protein [Sphingobium sp. H33]|uniref:PEPxxWA-CTERM sorting domain-containing protein n=2 Tax=Sphingobium nicotianae TaxID=2782607 RepID=A0A9X1DEP3_9SPHN|nr:PEPxxWA-CTERM sorting domain-containing protein [Sphingobium nicotianae]